MGLNPKKGLIWGITGSIGSGKTTLGEILKLYGFHNLEVDLIGHSVLEQQPIKRNLAKTFGQEIMNPDGTINRKELGKLAFSNSETISRLNAIMHPPMVLEVNRNIDDLHKKGIRLIAINAALLYTMGLAAQCETIIYVQASADIRLDRIVCTRGLPIERAKVRLAAQDPEPKNDPRVIYCENDGTIVELTRWVDEKLVKLFAEFYR